MVNRLKSTPDVAAVARAFQMATGLPTRERTRLRVGVLSADGVMLTATTLRGHEQAEFLRDQLQLLGFVEFVPERPADALGCDLLLKHVPESEGYAPDLLRADDALWPPPRTRGNPPPA